MFKMESVGLVVNPVSGQGAQRNLQIARRTIESLGIRNVVTGPGELGGDAVSWATIKTPPEPRGRDASQWVACTAAKAGVDLVVVVGGDGTLADVAYALFMDEKQTPILGIGAGSTNAGDLVTCLAVDVESGMLEAPSFEIRTMDALTASCNGQVMALAFNDVVIGTTILGTLDGRVIDLDAAAHLKGEFVAGEPRSIARKTASVVKKTAGSVLPVAGGSMVGTVIIGFVYPDQFYGKAIVGGVCLTSLVGLPAGCLVCQQPLVRTSLSVSRLAAIEPIRSAYTSFGYADSIEVSGLGAPAVLCADGNPLKTLEPDDLVSIGIVRDQVSSVRIVSD